MWYNAYKAGNAQCNTLHKKTGDTNSFNWNFASEQKQECQAHMQHIRICNRMGAGRSLNVEEGMPGVERSKSRLKSNQVSRMVPHMWSKQA